MSPELLSPKWSLCIYSALLQLVWGLGQCKKQSPISGAGVKSGPGKAPPPKCLGPAWPHLSDSLPHHLVHRGKLHRFPPKVKTASSLSVFTLIISSHWNMLPTWNYKLTLPSCHIPKPQKPPFVSPQPLPQLHMPYLLLVYLLSVSLYWNVSSMKKDILVTLVYWYNPVLILRISIFFNQSSNQLKSDFWSRKL